MKNAALSPPSEEEPPRGSSELALFDQCRVTKAPRLFDGDLPDHVEERFQRQPYTLSRKGRLRPFRGPAGEVVQRYRGGKGYTPIYETWRPERLLQVRGRLMAALVPTEGGGRVVSWTDHPRGWGATPPDLPPPYVLRQMIQVSAAHASEGNTLGPIIETDERLGPRWTARETRQIFLLELQEGWTKAMAWSHRVKTSINTANMVPRPGQSARALVCRYGQAVRCRELKDGRLPVPARISRAPNLSTASRWMRGSGRSSHAARSVASPSSLLDT